MALVKTAVNDSLTPWNSKDKRKIAFRVPEETEKPVIDYEKLKELVAISGLSDSGQPTSTNEAHKHFMANYKSVFVIPEKKKGFPIHSLERSFSTNKISQQVSTTAKTVGGNTKPEDRFIEKKLNPIDRISHDIKDYTRRLHVHGRQEKQQLQMLSRIEELRQLLKKPPYERSAKETEEIYRHLSHFPDLADQVSSHMLRELCVMAYLETWKDPSVPVFGNSGWHMVLKGTVRPQQIPWKKLLNTQCHFPNPTPEPLEDLDVLGVSEAFGTLEKVDHRSNSSRILSVTTLEPNCEFLKISTADFDRVKKQIEKRDEMEKINLLQSCNTFAMWARQPIARNESISKGHPLVKVASLLEWVNFPANTVLVSEGYAVPFLGIIKSGECHVLRQVEVKNDLPNGKVEKKLRQVVMGKLGTRDSFGEISLLDNKPITCSIITATEVEMGCISKENIEELDKTTKRLLHQSSEPTFDNLTKDEIHREYIGQQTKREWNEFKHKVVLDVLNSKGIRPGYGKWSK